MKVASNVLKRAKSCVNANGGLFGTQYKLGLMKNLGISWTKSY